MIGCWLGTGASNRARSMSYPTAELLGRVERRRRFSVEQKLAILMEATMAVAMQRREQIVEDAALAGLVVT